MGIKGFVKNVILTLKSEKLLPVTEVRYNNALLDNKIALITGGSGGIGKAIAKAFLDAGAKVIVAGTNSQKLLDCVEALGNSENVKSIIIDVENVNMLKDRVTEAVDLFPEKRIDILVNCAGVVNKNDFFGISIEEYDRVMNINARGTFFMCQNVAEYMIHEGIKGHILNVTSASALRPAWTPYQISKWAICGFTKGLADILISKGIVVNAIGPGPTATPMLMDSNDYSIYNPTNPSKRFAIPEEIANLAVFMVSSAGNYVVGETYYITGGGGTISYHG